MSGTWRDIAEFFPEFFSPDVRWVALISAGAAVTFSLHASYVFLRLTEVRSLLVFVPVDGQLPPVCGLSVLFGI